jgi:hypothetical protein
MGSALGAAQVAPYLGYSLGSAVTAQRCNRVRAPRGRRVGSGRSHPRGTVLAHPGRLQARAVARPGHRRGRRRSRLDNSPPGMHVFNGNR